MTSTRGTCAALVCVLAVAVLSAQPPAPVLHDLKAMPEQEVNANIKIKKVMGEIGTFMLGRFRAGFKSAPHHHTYEQINIGLTGMYTLPVAGTRHAVSAMRGVVIPPDVEHNNDVPGDAGDPELIEFQSTRRLDFPPERQQVTLPVGPTALPVPQGRQVGFDFGTLPSGWQTIINGIRMQARTGSTTAIASWELLPTAQDSVDLRLLLPGAERFIYVVEGAVEVTADTRSVVVSPGALLVSASGGSPLRVRRQGSQRAMLLVFEARR